MTPSARCALAGLMMISACASAPGIDRPMPVDAAYGAREETSREADDRCGPEFIERMLPGVFLSLVEPGLNGPFGPVCVRHDACYRLQEQSQAWCDTRMRTEMTDICNAGRGEGSAGAALCRWRAAGYHGLVDSPFGAYAYQGEAGGKIIDVKQMNAPKGKLEICITAQNDTHILQQYAVELVSAGGKRIARTPVAAWRKARAGERVELCAGTSGSAYWTLARAGNTVQVRLMADRPDVMTLGRDAVEVDRREIALSAPGAD